MSQCKVLLILGSYSNSHTKSGLDLISQTSSSDSALGGSCISLENKITLSVACCLGFLFYFHIQVFLLPVCNFPN